MTDAEREAELRCGPVSGLPRGGDVAFVIRLLDEARAQSGWRPIESAPKDGTIIFVYRPSAPPHRQVGEDYWQALLDREPYNCWWQSRGNEQPTLWQPLPTPPAE